MIPRPWTLESNLFHLYRRGPAGIFLGGKGRWVTILANNEPLLMAPNPTKAFTLVFNRLTATAQESLKYAEFDLARYKAIPNANRGRGQAIRRIREAKEKLKAIAAEKKAVLAWIKEGME